MVVVRTYLCGTMLNDRLAARFHKKLEPLLETRGLSLWDLVFQAGLLPEEGEEVIRGRYPLPEYHAILALVLEVDQEDLFPKVIFDPHMEWLEIPPSPTSDSQERSKVNLMKEINSLLRGMDSRTLSAVLAYLKVKVNKPS